MEIDADGGAALVPLLRRAWLASGICVPRRLCVFESVPCKGLAWHERRAFARLQVRRLAPYADTGCSAVVQGSVLMLWLWDQSEVQAAKAEAGLTGKNAHTIAEPLLLQRPAGSGRREVACADGVDVQTLAGGAIVASHWTASGSGAAARAPTYLPRAWAWDLIGHRELGAEETGRDSTGRLQRLTTIASLGLAIAGLSFASYWGSLLWRLESKRDGLQRAAEQTTRQLGDVASLQRSAVQDKDWVLTYQRLGQGMRWPDFVQALKPTMERYGVVVREMEVRQDEIRLAVVTAGSAIDLPGLLQALGAVPGVQDVQLRMNVDVAQATFSLRASGYMQAVEPPAAVR